MGNKFNVGDEVRSTISDMHYTVLVPKKDKAGDIVIVSEYGEYFCEGEVMLTKVEPPKPEPLKCGDVLECIDSKGCALIHGVRYLCMSDETTEDHQSECSKNHVLVGSGYYDRRRFKKVGAIAFVSEGEEG